MKKKHILILIVLCLTMLLTGCGSSGADELVLRADADPVASFTFAVSGKTQSGEAVSGTYTYAVSKGRHTTPSGDIDAIVVDTVNTQTAVGKTKTGEEITKTCELTACVKLYTDSLRPIVCEKRQLVDGGAQPGWSSTCTYADSKAAIRLIADDKTLLDKGEGTTEIPLSGVYYDSEELLILLRAIELTPGSTTALQTMNTQSGVSDFLSIVVAAQTETIEALGGQYVCWQVSVGSASLFTKPEIVFWITNDINRLPLRFKQSDTVYDLTAYKVN
ncbi:MAG: DUF3108 domain-containing protein [Eubacteriales bacterium]|nr:DUF3108 domain-containing protein [Eubacteriales bacterium]